MAKAKAKAKAKSSLGKSTLQLSPTPDSAHDLGFAISDVRLRTPIFRFDFRRRRTER